MRETRRVVLGFALVGLLTVAAHAYADVGASSLVLYLPFDENAGQTVYSNCEFRFDVPAGLVRQGENQLTLLLTRRAPRLEQFVTLDWARLFMDPTGSRD